MKKRKCDFCLKDIEGKYHKLCLVEYMDKRMTMNHSGDMCLSCYEEVKNHVSRQG
jgi:hypothetical protein